MLEKSRFEGDTVLIAKPGEPKFTITRTFDAPARLVFEAWTNPEYMKRWYGTSCMTLEVCEMDVRVGGAWRRVLRGNDGSAYGWRGVFLEIKAPEHMVFTEIFDPFPDHPSTVTVTLVEQNGKTHATVVQVHDSVVSRDAHIAAGMEQGMRETLDRLQTFLSSQN
jgi:uncharacterized protein YndB with AHSA1/START domain